LKLGLNPFFELIIPEHTQTPTKTPHKSNNRTTPLPHPHQPHHIPLRPPNRPIIPPPHPIRRHANIKIPPSQLHPAGTTRLSRSECVPEGLLYRLADGGVVVARVPVDVGVGAGVVPDVEAEEGGGDGWDERLLLMV